MEIERGARRGIARHLADDATSVDHGDAVRDREKLLDLAGDQQHGDPVSAASARMRPVTYSIAPTSRPRVG